MAKATKKKVTKKRTASEPDWRSSLWLRSDHREQLDRIAKKVRATTGQRVTQSMLVVAALDHVLPALDSADADPDLVLGAWVRRVLS